MPTDSSNQSTESQQNHRSALDEILGNTPAAPAVPPQDTPNTPPADNNPPAPPAIPSGDAPPIPPENKQEGAPSTDWIQKLTEISGGLITTEDDFKGTIEKVKKFGDLESQNQTLSQELEAAKNVNPFANDGIKKLNELYASGATPEQITLFNRINQLGDVMALSSRDAIKWQLQQKHNISESEADIMLKTRYKTDDTLYSEDEVSAANIQMKIEGDEAKSYIKGLQVSFDTKAPEAPVTETPEQLQQKADLYELQVTPIVKSIEQELPTYFAKINVNGLQGDKAETIDLPVPDEVKTHIASEVKKYATQYNIDLSKPENVKGLQDYAKNMTKMAMFESWIIDASNKREEKIREEFNNPSTINRGQDNPAATPPNARQARASAVASGQY